MTSSLGVVFGRRAGTVGMALQGVEMLACCAFRGLLDRSIALNQRAAEGREARPAAVLPTDLAFHDRCREHTVELFDEFPDCFKSYQLFPGHTIDLQLSHFARHRFISHEL